MTGQSTATDLKITLTPESTEINMLTDYLVDIEYNRFDLAKLITI